MAPPQPKKSPPSPANEVSHTHRATPSQAATPSTVRKKVKAPGSRCASEAVSLFARTSSSASPPHGTQATTVAGYITFVAAQSGHRGRWQLAHSQPATAPCASHCRGCGCVAAELTGSS
jgi:hypothetical protein